MIKDRCSCSHPAQTPMLPLIATDSLGLQVLYLVARWANRMHAG